MQNLHTVIGRFGGPLDTAVSKFHVVPTVSRAASALPNAPRIRTAVDPSFRRWPGGWRAAPTTNRLKPASKLGFFALISLAGTALGTPPSTGSSASSSTTGGSGVAELFLVVQDSGLPSPQCRAPGQSVEVTVEVGPTPLAVVGGQFLIRYDPACMDFVEVTPGSFCDADSAFASTIFLEVDESQGRVFYAVAIPPGGHGQFGPTTLACLTFDSVADCANCDLCFDSEFPQQTRLSDRLGNPIPVTTQCSGPVSTVPEVAEVCPADAVVKVPCDATDAVVAWPAPQLIEGCDGPLPLNCTAQHSGGLNVDGLIAGGGAFPLGVSTFCCVAQTDCGGKEACCWTVTVEAALDTPCDDGNPCTLDLCDHEHPDAGPDGCLHMGQYRPDGDAFPPGGDGMIDLDDVLCVLDGFFDAAACPGGDLAPCGGDGEIDLADIVAVLDAFSLPPTCPCP